MRGLAIFLGLALAGQAPVLSTEQVERPTVVESEGFDQRLVDTVRAIAEQVERIRDERFAGPPLAVRAPDPMREVVAEIRAFNVLTRERLAARGRAWKDLGLGDVDSPAAFLLALATDLDGISFEPSGRRLLVSPELLTVEDFLPTEGDAPGTTVLMMTGVRPHEPLVGHFLMHAMQAQRDAGATREEMTDRLLARAMWNEGEANLLALRYLFEGMGMADQVVALAMDPRDVLGGQLVPSSLDRLSAVEGALLDFVYLEGFEQAAEAYLAGGWRGLDRAMSRRKTTSQILHGREIDPSREAFGEPPSSPGEGLVLVDTDSLGEQGIIALVSILTGKDNLGLIAGDGWAGDRLYRWEPAASPRVADGVTVWLSRWAREEDAADLDYAIGRALEARFPGRSLQAAANGGRRLSAAGRLYEIERSGVELRLQIGPEGADRTAPPPPASKAD